MTDIGAWMARFKDGEPVTTAHYIESEVATRVVTRCGRQMERRTYRGEMAVSDNPRCLRCQPDTV